MAQRIVAQRRRGRIRCRYQAVLDVVGKAGRLVRRQIAIVVIAERETIAVGMRKTSI